VDEDTPTELSYLLTALGCVDLLVRAMVARVREGQPGGDPYRGLYIDEAEVDRLRDEAMGVPTWLELDAGVDRRSLQSMLDRQRERLEALRYSFEARGVTPRLELLCSRFGLDAFEREVLLLVLLVELDPRYERMFGYLHDDVTRRQPSIDLALNLLCGDLETKLSRRAHFSARRPLLRHQLLRSGPPSGESHSTLLRQELRVDERVVSFLFGDDPLPDALADWVRTELEPCERVEEPAPDLREPLERAQAVLAARGIVYLQGPRGVGRRGAGVWLANLIGRGVLVVDGATLALASERLVEVTRLAIREARLRDAVLYWDGLDPLLDDAKQHELTLLLDGVRDAGVACILAGAATFELGWRHGTLEFRRVQFRIPTRPERVSLWRRALGPHAENIDGPSLERLASQFRLTRAKIFESAATARNLAAVRRDDGRPTSAECFEAARVRSRPKLHHLARRVEARHGWDELVLPGDQQRQLEEIVAHVRYRGLVFDHWGFERKLSYGRGLAVLFSGQSGTGKTLAAGIIAGELGLDLYRIDLSSVVSKYIGETEKNLARVFDEAATSNAILFFDEADALFGKRSEVRDSHDRYANIEVGYLLQRMEDYEGITILATNARASMDPAFVRRMAFSVDFPFPEAPERRRIWERAIPPETPRGDDLDIDELAARFRITGGNIRNIALSAAFLAASNGKVVKMEHVVQATRREYQKLGRVCAAREFGPLFIHLQGEGEQP
jgi:DNA polymerase III delta prime subunit